MKLPYLFMIHSETFSASKQPWQPIKLFKTDIKHMPVLVVNNVCTKKVVVVTQQKCVQVFMRNPCFGQLEQFNLWFYVK